MLKYLGDGLWVDDDPHSATKQIINGEEYWFFPFAETASAERIEYGYAASRERYPKKRSDLVHETLSPESPMLLAEPFNALVTDGVSIEDIDADIGSSGSPPYYVEDTVWGWIGYKSDYAELANAYGLDPDDYEGPGVYDLRSLDRQYRSIDEFEKAAAEHWIEEAMEYMAQGDGGDDARAMLMEELGGDPEDLDAIPRGGYTKKKKGPGFEFLN